MKEKGENCFFLEKNIKQKKPSFRVKKGGESLFF